MVILALITLPAFGFLYSKEVLEDGVANLGLRDQRYVYEH